jgi:hypothetical protein
LWQLRIVQKVSIYLFLSHVVPRLLLPSFSSSSSPFFFFSSGAVLTFDTYFHNNEWKLATGGSDGKLKLWDIKLSTTPLSSDSLPLDETKEGIEEDNNMLIES